jgi:hypothetical protein
MTPTLRKRLARLRGGLDLSLTPSEAIAVHDRISAAAAPRKPVTTAVL